MAAWALDAVMLFGDSITQGSFEPGMTGFGQRLSHDYARKLDVVNRGLSGYNTSWAIPVFEQIIAKQTEQAALPKIRLLTIWFGANDACLEVGGILLAIDRFFDSPAVQQSPQHVPLPKFIANLEKMIEMVTDPASLYHSPWTKIILITPPPVNTIQRAATLAARNPPIELDRNFQVTREYANAVSQVGAKYALPVVDAWGAIWKASGEKEDALPQLLIDGLHFSEAGYKVEVSAPHPGASIEQKHTKVAYDEFDKVLRAAYPDLHHENRPLVFPKWDELNWKDPVSSLKERAVRFHSQEV